MWSLSTILFRASVVFSCSRWCQLRQQTLVNSLFSDHLEQQAVRERQQISKWDRLVLEDKYLKLQEDNLLLKKHARKQEDKLKKYVTYVSKPRTGSLCVPGYKYRVLSEFADSRKINLLLFVDRRTYSV